MMVRVGAIKVFPSLLAFLCTTRISLCIFYVNHNAQFISPSSIAWIMTTNALGTYLFPYLIMKIYVMALSS